ncbi:MAG TPA: DUF3267 domain-containing protein [Verrucomicrobiota bacterium]|jgi:hypothetical protein|nr:DUF3267 domain-containing protein [Verrucomicrobiota bacterium]HQL80217.1 DUF3267 domain-containing protein [Verrucomicrobiota bacterium]
MRFHFGAVPTSPDFAPDTSWKSLREPSPWLAQFIGLPIGAVTAALIAVLWGKLTPLWDAPFTMTPWVFLLLCGGIPVVHELIHAATDPMGGRSEHSIVGFWPSRLLFYAHYDGELSRNRLVAILLMPLFVLSILPLLLAMAMQSAALWIAFVSAYNALSSCVDLLGAVMVLYQIPASATVRNQGWKTYWREREELCRVPG